jgi:alpha-tubulin suppressor-like RCC1 family protein
MSDINITSLVTNLQTCINAATVSTPSADIMKMSIAAGKMTSDKIVSVASAAALPDIKTSKINPGTIVFVESIMDQVISYEQGWVGMDGRIFRQDIPSTTLWTWGTNVVGALGDGTTTNKSSPVTTAGGGTNWYKITSTSGIKTDGSLWVWGDNSTGLLGDGTTVNKSSPVSIPGSWTDITVNFAKASDGRFFALGGYNTAGQLLNCTYINRSSPSLVVDCWLTISSTNFTNINMSTVGIKSDNTLWTIGQANSGELGDGTTIIRSSPVTTAGGGTNWCYASGGYRAMSALKTDGTLWVWGANSNGQLGDGTNLNKSSPVTIAGGGTTWCKIITSKRNGSAIKTDGTLWTWGDNTAGALGYNCSVTAGTNSPVTTAGGGTTWCNVAVGYRNIAAIKTDGTLWSWGCNTAGQVGDGTTVSRSSPIQIAGTWCSIVGALACGTTDGFVALKI